MTFAPLSVSDSRSQPKAGVTRHVEEPPCRTGESQVREPEPEPTDAVTVGPWKWAVAVAAAEMARPQELDPPAHAPVQPVKESPGRATAVSVTSEPERKPALWLPQAAPQEIAAGLEVTVPRPVSERSLLAVSW